MKRVGMVLVGLILMVLMFAALYISGAIYQAGDHGTIDTYFFQTNGKSTMRAALPIRPTDLGADQMRELLIRKFVYEYFYAVPDAENIARRTRPTSTLWYMSSDDVFSAWTDTVAVDIQTLADARAMRTVRVIGEIVKPADGDFWVVNYELTTWYAPNDMDALPDVGRGTMYISLFPQSEPDKIRQTVNLESELTTGRDPATMFKFMVNRVELH